jgi:hypothetical protein
MEPNSLTHIHTCAHTHTHTHIYIYIQGVLRNACRTSGRKDDSFRVKKMQGQYLFSPPLAFQCTYMVVTENFSVKMFCHTLQHGQKCTCQMVPKQKYIKKKSCTSDILFLLHMHLAVSVIRCNSFTLYVVFAVGCVVYMPSPQEVSKEHEIW